MAAVGTFRTTLSLAVAEVQPSKADIWDSLHVWIPTGRRIRVSVVMDSFQFDKVDTMPTFLQNQAVLSYLLTGTS